MKPIYGNSLVANNSTELEQVVIVNWKIVIFHEKRKDESGAEGGIPWH